MSEEKARLSCAALVVEAICRDFEGRERALERGSVKRRVQMEYHYLNAKIFEGVAEITGTAPARAFIKEIGSGIGYSHSEVSWMSESTYKRYKRRAIENIARKLHYLN